MKIRKNKNNKINTFYISVFTVLIVIFMEIFVFNFRYFQTRGYENILLKKFVSDENITSDDGYVFHFNSNNAKITFNDINKEVKNIYVDLECADELPKNPSDNDIKNYEAAKLIKVKVKIDDYSKSGGIDMPERSIVSTVDRTKYLFLNLKGKSDGFTLTFNNVKDKNYIINEISINKSVPFSFNIVRVIVILVILGILYVIRPNSKFYSYSLNLKNIKQKALIGAVVVIQILLMLTAAHINTFYVHNTVSWQNQYNELADAVISGHYYIDYEPDEKLKEMDNPYDPDERKTKEVTSYWDHSYFEGKYYVYFGIVPALIFNVPYKLIFGGDLKPFGCILMLIPIFVLLSYTLIYIIAKRFLKNGSISLLLYIMLATVFINGIGTAFALVWPDMYTLPIFTAVILAIGGLCCYLTAFKNINEKEYKLKKINLFLGSFFISLIAGCRPQLLLVLFLSVPLFWRAVFNDRKLFSKASVKESLSFILPIIAVALFMFHYNYARFGSVFDFGANYNLTTNDMTSRGIKLGRVFQGLFYYILQPLNVEGVFPYIAPVNFSTIYMGVNIKEVMYGGALFLQPLVLILFIIPKIKEDLKKSGLFGITALSVIFAVVIALADSVMAGLLSRYYMDFMWLLVFASIIVVFTAYNKYRERDYLKILNCFVPLCFIISMYICFAVVIGARYYSPAETNPEVYWRIASMIQFWL